MCTKALMYPNPKTVHVAHTTKRSGGWATPLDGSSPTSPKNQTFLRTATQYNYCKLLSERMCVLSKQYNACDNLIGFGMCVDTCLFMTMQFDGKII